MKKALILWGLPGIVVIFALSYFHSVYRKNRLYKQLIIEIKKLEEERNDILKEREEMLAQIESESDPAWIEMVLKENLGVLPKNQTKVYFE